MDKRIHFHRPKSNLFKDSWVWKMAWRDARNNFSRLFLFISSIIIGIAALVAINSFHINLQDDIDSQAKELLGADLVAEANNPFEPEIIQLFDTLQFPQSKEASFASMVYFSDSEQTRLIRVVAIGGGFPYYGEVKTRPLGRYDDIFSSPVAILDESLASQYNVSEGDTIKIGKMNFIAYGEMLNFPGASEVSTTLTPSIYISYDYLDSTGLVQFGSRVNYKRYFKTSSTDETAELDKKIRPTLRKYGHGTDDVEERKEDLGEGLANLYKFFNLLAFVALILGCIGIASSVHIYANEKRQTTAVLRCLGASGGQAFNIFLIQIFFSGLVGSIIGIGVGLGIQFGLPVLLKEFFPLDIHVTISWFSIVEGLVLGISISVLFAILPLLSVRYIPPLDALRLNENNKIKLSKPQIAIGALLVLFPLFFAAYQTEDILTGLSFFGGLFAALIALFFLGKFVLWSAKKYFPNNASFVLRQALSNLHRPNNQTVVMVVVIGLGAFLLSTLLIIQTSLLNQVEFIGEENQSNTILFDIQSSQKDGVAKLTKTNGLPINQMVPIITCRLESLAGKTIAEIQKDTTDGIRNWALTREYRVTYRDSLNPSESIIEGRVHQIIEKDANNAEEDSILVSISSGMQENLELDIGDEVIFDVQGIPIKTYIGGIREVEWSDDPPNFIFVFPTGVLEEAPQIYVLTTRITSQQEADKYSRELVASFPNVSLIDLRLILKTIQDFFGKVSFIIRFLALFSIVTGLIVLAGAVINSKYARIKENVLLRTMGASRKQVTGITVIEYMYLGIFSALTGILLSILSSWILAVFAFDMEFSADVLGLFYIAVGVILLTIVIGYLNTRSILGKSPLEVLRKED